MPLQRAYSSKGGKREVAVGADGGVKFQVQGPKRGSSSINEHNEEPEKPRFTQDEAPASLKVNGIQRSTTAIGSNR